MFNRLTKNWYRFHVLQLVAAGLAVFAVSAAAHAQTNAPQLAVTSSTSTVPYNVAPSNVPSNVGYSGIPGPSQVIGLPDGSGLDVIRHLRASQPLRAIAISGFGQDDDLRMSFAAGFERHLTKPINLHVLREAVDQLTA